MSATLTQRRRLLAFTSLTQILPDVDRLRARGHATVGQWSLAQICNHLALAFNLGIDGTPHKSSLLFRRTIGPIIRTACLTLNRIPTGVRMHHDYIPLPALDLNREAHSLRAAIDRYRSHPGPFDEHPKMGRFTRPQADRFHCIHSAHHLSFAIPTDA